MNSLTPAVRHWGPARTLLPDQLPYRVRVRTGLAPGGDPQPQRQIARRVQFGVEGEAVPVRVHGVAAGEPGGGHRAQGGCQPVAALLTGGPGRGPLDEFAGGVLQQQPGRPPRRVAHHLGGLVERPGAVHPRQLQRARARQHRVGVEELEQGRYAVEHGGEGGGLHRRVAEGVRVRPHACSHAPGASRRTSPASASRTPARSVQPDRSSPCVSSAPETGWRCPSTRPGDHRALEVDHRGRGVGQRPDLPVAAQRGRVRPPDTASAVSGRNRPVTGSSSRAERRTREVRTAAPGRSVSRSAGQQVSRSAGQQVGDRWVDRSVGRRKAVGRGHSVP